jgi:hypothetical protein
MAAILMIPVVACAGVALDLADAYSLKSRLEDAADAAAVGAIAKMSPGVQAALQMTGDGPINAGNDDASMLFRANLTGTDIDKVLKFTPNVRKTSGEVVADVVFNASMPTTLLRIIGINEVNLSGTASASIRTDFFADFYMLLDNTPSMGIGATPADVKQMVDNTSDKCAFACHETKNPNNYYNLAKKLGVTMRIDVVRQATQALMDTARTNQQFPNQFRAGIYTFGQSATDTKLDEITPITADLSGAKVKAAQIDLMTIPSQGYNNDQMTSFDDAFTKLNAKIDTPGTGTSNTNRAKYVFFVADGAGDSYKPNTCTKKTIDGRCQEPIDTKYCDVLKSRGINIAVLYTTYLDLPTNSWWNTWIKPFQSEIGQRMQACASDGLYFEVSPTEGISDAMNKLFKKIVLNPRLTG